MTIHQQHDAAPGEGEIVTTEVDVTTGAVVSGPPPAPLKTWQVEAG